MGSRVLRLSHLQLKSVCVVRCRCDRASTIRKTDLFLCSGLFPIRATFINVKSPKITVNKALQLADESDTLAIPEAVRIKRVFVILRVWGSLLRSGPVAVGLNMGYQPL